VGVVNDLRRPSASVCHPLREDPELAEAIDPDRRSQAIETCVAREVRVPVGSWTGHRTLLVDDGIGLLVLEGLLIRRVGINARFGAELLGEGDLLRPCLGDAPSTLPLTVDWLVLEPTRVAILDERFTRQLTNYPELVGPLVGRAMQRSRSLAVNMAIVHQARVDIRLHMLLRHLAGRWGRVRSDGIVVPLPLTHTVLSDLVAARRPTVTSALSELARQGVVLPIREGWLLFGDPPGEVSEPPLMAPKPTTSKVAANSHVSRLVVNLRPESGPGG
jgi:CRP/FNR family cyclic AMP-dependent transcriptional regulator